MTSPQGEPFDHDDYLRHRDNIDRLRVEQSSSLDKTLLTLSSSALAFSMVIFTAFSKYQQPEMLPALWLSWIFFVLALLANLISYWAGAKSNEIEMDNLDARQERREAKANWAHGLTDLLNGVGILGFVVGVISLLIFASANAGSFTESIPSTNIEAPKATSTSGEGKITPTTSGGSDISQTGTNGAKPPIPRPAVPSSNPATIVPVPLPLPKPDK